jgi:hypothetical protein
METAQKGVLTHVVTLAGFPFLLNAFEFPLDVLFVVFQELLLYILNKQIQSDFVMKEVILKVFLIRKNWVQTDLKVLIRRILNAFVLNLLMDVFDRKFGNKFEVLFASFGLKVIFEHL